MSSSRGSSSWNSEINGAPMEMTCRCGDKVYLKTSWTQNNPGRRYWACPKYGQKFGFCGFFIWYDPEICARAKNIIPGLLEKSNKHQYQIEQYKLRNAEMEAQLLVAMKKVDDMNNALVENEQYKLKNAELEAQLLVAMNNVDDMKKALVVCKNKIKKLWAATILLSLLYLVKLCSN
ncbi:GRF zinc finger containing protein [Striga asiatica]|uniref:GRF zinc finger containing protein n=1 Tax=Striga asiatica TaxID=4170 RepID=A0A5A7QZE1_STRAF|nr:GRF zinc finger containing protein [Striga asiatica]GER49797.1 GRF zinc finger containing protein [Striga asiatica]